VGLKTTLKLKKETTNLPKRELVTQGLWQNLMIFRAKLSNNNNKPRHKGLIQITIVPPATSLNNKIRINKSYLKMNKPWLINI